MIASRRSDAAADDGSEPESDGRSGTESSSDGRGAGPPDGADDERTPRRGSGVSPPTILIADGPNRADRYRQWLDGVYPVRVASSKSEAREKSTQAVGVGVFGAGVTDDAKEELLEALSVRSPFSRAVVVESGDEPPMLADSGYDHCLFEPVEKEALRETVDRLARIATYERAVSAFFEYTTHAANLEVGRGDGQLGDDEVYADLQDRIERTKTTLNRIRAHLDEADRRVLMESIEADPVGAGFDVDAVRSTGGSRFPDKCSDCGLAWGVDHGGTLGEGFEQLGAFVWKCTNCGAVQQMADPSHRRLARR